MSASNEWTEWHLTPQGWARGTEKEDFRRIDREPPEDRVLTVRYRQFIGSVYSGMKESTETIWESEDKKTIVQLKKQFGEAPQTL
ncbi:MAG TPA: hypothetical protein PKH39_07180 [Woeseiaceae bacterium]|nr:hypothetical protein [Woeseiaceae bacterium]